MHDVAFSLICFGDVETLGGSGTPQAHTTLLLFKYQPPAMPFQSPGMPPPYTVRPPNNRVAAVQQQPPRVQHQQPHTYQQPHASFPPQQPTAAPAGRPLPHGAGPQLSRPHPSGPPRSGPPPSGPQPDFGPMGSFFHQMPMAVQSHQPQPSLRDIAIFKAGAVAAAAAEAKAMAEWEDAERKVKLDQRKFRDKAADAVVDLTQVCEEADAALRAAEQHARQSRAKLVDLERFSQQVQQMHQGCPATERGTASRWNSRGFGFINSHVGGPDLFCHISDILDGTSLKEGSKVRFVRVYEELKDKYRATEVTGGHTDGDGE